MSLIRTVMTAPRGMPWPQNARSGAAWVIATLLFGTSPAIAQTDTVHVGTCGPMPVNSCSAAPICKLNPIFGGTWVSGSPKPKGTPCTIGNTVNGTPGTCNGLGSCLGPSAASDVVIPNYEVVTVLYAPPGLDGGKSTSYVEYGSGSKAGSTVSASKTFKSTLGVSVTAGAGVGGNGASVTVGYNNSTSTTNKDTLEITKSQQETLRVTGPTADGINHDEDEIWIWLNPRVTVTLLGSNVTWSIDAGNVITQYLTVAQLKGWIANPSSVDGDDVGKQLKVLGFQTSDYQTILSADVFANGVYRIDPKQFTQTSYNIPYEPPQSGSGSTLKTVQVLNEAKDTQEKQQSASTDLSVSMTAKFSSGFTSVSATVSDQWDWTNEDSKASSADGTQNSTFAIGQPSASYTGPTNIAVYWDNIWQTFLFVPTTLSGTPILSGILTAANGQVQAYAPVSFQSGNSRYRTFTDQQGRYAFYAPDLVLNGTRRPATLSAAGVNKSVKLGSTPMKVNLRGKQ